MCTLVYIKTDAKDQLLLSEGVCNQLHIITYHSAVTDAQLDVTHQHMPAVIIPCVRVKLLQTVRIPPFQSKNVPVQLEGTTTPNQSFLIEPCECRSDDGLYIGNSLVQAVSANRAQVVITNLSALTQKMSKGCQIGQCSEVNVVQSEELSKVHQQQSATARVMSTSTSYVDARKKKLAAILTEEGTSLQPQNKDRLLQLLQEFHYAFVLEDGERGETDLLKMEIDTGDAAPQRQPTRRTPFAAREEISQQLSQMQEQGVIRPSSSPWASPVVLVRKKDGSLRFVSITGA